MMRLIIKILSKSIMDEVYFSGCLSLKENLDLYFKLKEINLNNYYVVLKRNNGFLDTNNNPIDMNLINGDILYIYA